MAAPQPDLHTQVTLVTGQGEPVAFAGLDPQSGGWLVSDPQTHSLLVTIQVQLAAIQARLDLLATEATLATRASQATLVTLATEATLAAMLARQADGTQRTLVADGAGSCRVADVNALNQLRITAV